MLSKIRERNYLLKELYYSEQNYCKYLTIMKDLYLEPMRRMKKPLSKEEEKCLFSNLEQISMLGQKVLESLTAASIESASASSNMKLFEAFAKNIPFMKMYNDYVKNYEKAANFLNSERVKKDKDLCTILLAGKKDPRSQGLELRDLISKPFQRIFAYKNIFQRMLELTPKETISFVENEKILQALEAVVIFINESKRQLESEAKILSSISEKRSSFRVQQLLLQRWRVYIKEDRVLFKSSTDSMYDFAECFLANDIFFYIHENEVNIAYLCFCSVEKLQTSCFELCITNTFLNCNWFMKFGSEKELNDWFQLCEKQIRAEKAEMKERAGIDPVDAAIKLKEVSNFLQSNQIQLQGSIEKLNDIEKSFEKTELVLNTTRNIIREELKKVAQYLQNSKELVKKFSDLKNQHQEMIQSQEKNIYMFKICEEKVKSVMRGDDKAYHEFFKNYTDIFSKSTDYLTNVLIDVTKLPIDELTYCQSVIPVLNINFESLILNPALKQELRGLGLDSDGIIAELNGLLGCSDAEQLNLDLLKQNIELRQRYRLAEHTVQILKEEKNYLSGQLFAEKKKQEVIKQLINTIEDKSIKTDLQVVKNESKILELSERIDELLQNSSKLSSYPDIKQILLENEQLKQKVLENNVEVENLKDRLAKHEQKLQQQQHSPQDLPKPVVLRDAPKRHSVAELNDQKDDLKLQLLKSSEINEKLQKEIFHLHEQNSSLREHVQELSAYFDHRIKSVEYMSNERARIHLSVNKRLTKNNALLSDQLNDYRNIAAEFDTLMRESQAAAVHDLQTIKQYTTLLEKSREQEDVLRQEIVKQLFQKMVQQRGLETIFKEGISNNSRVHRQSVTSSMSMEAISAAILENHFDLSTAAPVSPSIISKTTTVADTQEKEIQPTSPILQEKNRASLSRSSSMHRRSKHMNQQDVSLVQSLVTIEDLEENVTHQGSHRHTIALVSSSKQGATKRPSLKSEVFAPVSDVQKAEQRSPDKSVNSSPEVSTKVKFKVGPSNLLSQDLLSNPIFKKLQERRESDST